MLSSTLRASRSRAYATIASSGAPVASLNYGQPTSSVTVLVKAGSRFETKPGVAHALKHFAFKDNAKRSALRTIRETELFGGVLSASLSREYLALTADFLPGNEAYFVDVLASQIASPNLARHEFIETVGPAVKNDAIAAANDPAIVALDLAHGLAFHQGLGHSLFASASSHLTATDVKEYASKVFAKENIAVIGTGVDETLLKNLVAEHFAEATSGSAQTATASKYFGGESRVAPSPESHSHGPQTVFIGFGSSAPSAELAVLAAFLDTTTSIKWAQSTSPIASVLPSGTTVQSVYLPYSDAALAGVLIQSHSATDVKTTAVAVANAIKEVQGGSLKGDAFKIAHAKAAFRAASALEARDAQIAALGGKLLGSESSPLEAVSQAVQKVTDSSFSKAASTLLKGKPTYVAVGDINTLPYVEDLGL